MAIEPGTAAAPPAQPARWNATRLAELILPIVGFLAILAYYGGRRYYDAYYGAFNVSPSELGIAREDILFKSSFVLQGLVIAGIVGVTSWQFGRWVGAAPEPNYGGSRFGRVLQTYNTTYLPIVIDRWCSFP
jgi:hypothetical protein